MCGHVCVAADGHAYRGRRGAIRKECDGSLVDIEGAAEFPGQGQISSANSSLGWRTTYSYGSSKGCASLVRYVRGAFALLSVSGASGVEGARAERALYQEGGLRARAARVRGLGGSYISLQALRGTLTFPPRTTDTGKTSKAARCLRGRA